MQVIEEFFVSEFANIILKFIKLTIVLFFVTHWNACLFFAVGRLELANRGEAWFHLQNI
jgi:hypothetical protein